MINDRNQQYWVGLASRLNKRDLEREIAAHSPRAATPERVRYLNQTTLELQMPISEEGYNQIERAREVMMSAQGRPLTREEVVVALAKFYLERKDPVRKAERALKRAKQSKARQTKKSVEHETNDQKSQGQSDQGKPGDLLTTPDTKESTDSQKSSLPGQIENSIAPDQQMNLALESALSRSDDRSTCTNGKTQSPTQPARPHVRRKALKASVRHAATARDQGACQQRLPTGELCGQKVWTELHHLTPVSHGGADTVDNLITLCRAHHEMHHLFDELERDWFAAKQTQSQERFNITHPHPVNAI